VQSSLIASELSKAESNFAAGRTGMSDQAKGYGFEFDAKLNFRNVQTLAGSPDWLKGVDPSKVQIELHGRLVPLAVNDDGTEVETLLESNGDALVTRQVVGEGQVIVVTNGSFLLNLPLVNHEHRKLAGSLIDEIGENRRVVFLEASGSPEVLDEEPTANVPSTLDFLGVYPFNYVLLQLAVAGMIFCFARLPIFGKPRDDQPTQLSDFGEHVSALGELLAKTGDRHYAASRLAHFQQIAHGDGAARPAGGSNPTTKK
jgi:hypothetical protein